MSKLHAVLSCQGSFAAIKDAHSTNGTYVNGARVDATPVLDGDRLRLADVELLYCLKDDPTAELVEARVPDLDEPGADEPGRPGGHRSAAACRSAFRSSSPSRRALSVGEGVAFSLLTRGREVPALITYDALATHFGAYAFGEDGCSRAVDAFEANHVAINVAATYRYETLQQEPVILRSRDF